MKEEKLENEDNSAEQLEQLERLLLSRFDLASSDPIPTHSTPKEQSNKPQDDSKDLVQDQKSLQVSFKLLSTDKSPQLINIQAETVTPEVKPEVVIYPEKSIESKRILDVDDESKEVKKLRRKQIKSMAIDHITLRTLAEQIPNRPGPLVVSYRTKKNPKIPVESTKTDSSHETALDQEINPSATTTPRRTYLAKLDAIVPDVKPKKNEPQVAKKSLKASKNATQGDLKPNRSMLTSTQKRKNRRSRQAYRRTQLQAIDQKIDLTIPKLVKMTYI
ncbi:uncharacterized protein MELLADRAFT_60428 [Melampsora larici-populina 98AG31]|uniref:Uncharacterized protein n=1 Tax=Melampsora larici-populina (strain 98AG31 / pathotype 3-4-7) TaxID=747676 RepID=F4RA29_MELLP|nr:uncharacterized protein MELLADRAFT_60428 [Melampsora larici-populina 98AG31]EGG10638.1 hypothetical protein MELLADRAFT_60428 [Melampsora larici-populina 98AG31]